jgi:hypothetical protein
MQRRWTRLMVLTRASLSGSNCSSSWIHTSQFEVTNTSNTSISSRMDFQRIGSSAYLLMSFREIESLISLEESADNTRMFRTFQMRKGLECIPNHTISVKNYYMSQPGSLFMGFNTFAQQTIALCIFLRNIQGSNK